MIKVRKAELRDAEAIFEWRNDELTRKMSHSTDAIRWEGHREWFASSLDNKNRLLLLCKNEIGSRKIAMIRFDVISSRALVSINLSPQMRGKGLSKLCLSEAIKYFKNEFPQVLALDAGIKAENIASQRVFKSIGFVSVRDSVDALYFECPLC